MKIFICMLTFAILHQDLKAIPAWDSYSQNDLKQNAGEIVLAQTAVLTINCTCVIRRDRSTSYIPVVAWGPDRRQAMYQARLRCPEAETETYARYLECD